MRAQHISVPFFLLTVIINGTMAALTPSLFTLELPGFDDPHCVTQVPGIANTFFICFYTSGKNLLLSYDPLSSSSEPKVSILETGKATLASFLSPEYGSTTKIAVLNTFQLSKDSEQVVKADTYNQGAASCSNSLVKKGTNFMFYQNRQNPGGVNIPKLFRMDFITRAIQIYPVYEGAFDIRIDSNVDNILIGTISGEFHTVDTTKTFSGSLISFTKANAIAWMTAILPKESMELIANNDPTDEILQLNYFSSAETFRVPITDLSQIIVIEHIPETSIIMVAGQDYYIVIVDYKLQAVTNKYTMTQTVGGDPSYFTILEGTRVALIPVKTVSQVMSIKVDEVPCHPTCGGCNLDASAKGCTSCLGEKVLINGVCDCPKGKFFDENGGCSICQAKCSDCSVASDVCVECAQGYEKITGASSDCLKEDEILKLKNTNFFKNQQIIQLEFSIPISIETGTYFYEISLVDKDGKKVDSDIELTKVTPNGKKVDFQLKINSDFSNSSIQIKKTSLIIKDPITSVDKLQTFKEYPIAVDLHSFKYTSLYDYYNYLRGIAIFGLILTALFILPFDPMYFLFMFKFLQILDYIEFFDIVMPQNMVFFFKVIDLHILRIIPDPLKRFSEETECDLFYIYDSNGYSCSSYQNLAPFVVVFVVLGLGILVKNFIIFPLREKRRQNKIEIEKKNKIFQSTLFQEEKKEKKNLKKIFGKFIGYIFSIRFMLLCLFAFQIEFVFSAAISLWYIKNQKKIINIFGLIFAILGLLCYVVTIGCVSIEILISLIENRVSKTPKLEKQKQFFKKYFSSILQVYELPRDHSLLYLLFQMLQDLLLPFIFVISKKREKIQFIFLFITIVKQLIHASFGKAFVSKWIILQEVVGYGVYTSFLVFFGVLVFWDLSEENAYYFIGYPSIALIVLSLAHSMITSIVNGISGAKELLEKIEFADKKKDPKKIKIIAKDLDQEKTDDHLPDPEMIKESTVEIKKMPKRVSRISSSSQRRIINKKKKQAKTSKYEQAEISENETSGKMTN